MAGVHGEKLYGQVERKPGDSYVSTMFWHLNYIPIIPLRSYHVVDGSERSGQFHGERIPLRWKSVMVGYLRGWLGATAIIAAFIGGMNIGGYLVGRNHPFTVAASFGVAGALAGLVWFVLITERRLFVTVQALLIGLSYSWWSLVVAKLAAIPGDKPDVIVKHWPAIVIANAALLLYSLTRYFTHAWTDDAMLPQLQDDFGTAAR